MGRQLICEVVLLDEVNTDQGHAKALSELLSPFEREELLVNLIPYNDIHGLVARGATMDKQTAQLRAPTLDTVRSFQRSLWQNGLYCSVRQARGESKASACGQLATIA